MPLSEQCLVGAVSVARRPPQPLIVLVSPDAELAERAAAAMRLVDWRIGLLASFRDVAAEKLLRECAALVFDARRPEKRPGAPLADLSTVVTRVPVVAIVDGAGIQAAISLMRRGTASVVDLREGLGELCPAIQESICSWRERSEFDASAQDARRRLERLKRPELDVVDLVMRGYRNCAIARALSVSQRSIEARRAKAMRTMNAATPVEFAYRMLLAELGGGERGATERLVAASKRWLSDATS